VSRQTSTDKNELGLRISPEAQPSGSGYTSCPLSELASDISRTNRVDCAVANSPEIDFALVLSRTIDSIKNDPSQLRNTVYELARTKLLMLAWEQNPRITVLGLRRAAERKRGDVIAAPGECRLCVPRWPLWPCA
jgi:hypothetical protein